jgi:toxin ParE1/3/4
MSPRWEESEFLFCDLQEAACYIKRENPIAARNFLEAAYDTFEFIARHPGVGRTRADTGFPQVRSWRVQGFRRFLIFYQDFPDRVRIWRVLHGARDLPAELAKQQPN